MNAKDLLDAFQLPANAFVNHRVPKKLLVENGAPTPADVRQINEGIEDLYWVAALKPNTIGVTAYRDDTREVLEIAVLCLTLRSGAKSARLSEIVHRAVPYPIVLIVEHESILTFSLANKRWSEGEREKTVLDGDIIEAQLNDELNEAILLKFLKTLALANQSRNSLYVLYHAWMDKIFSLQAARITGEFVIASNEEHAAARREALFICKELEAKISSLQTAAAKEKQVPRMVEHNLTLKRLRDEYAIARAKL